MSLRRGLVKVSAFIGAVAMSMVGMVATANTANAADNKIGPQAVAQSGQGRYQESIDWMEWADQADQTITDPKVVWSTPHDAGNNEWISTQCTVSPQSGGSLETYRSGEFYGDALLSMYNVGTNNIVGVANQKDAATVTFGYSCKEFVMDSTGAPTLGSDTDTSGMEEVPLEGLVFADAESNNYTYYQQETIQATPTSTENNPTWRLLDSYRTQGCTTSSLAQVNDATKAMTFRSDGGQCANNGVSDKGPASVMFLQNSQGSTVSVKGGGRTAVALGVVPSFDFGDAPDSYGVASAQFGPQWEGGELGTDITANGGWYNLSEARENGVNTGTNVANDSGLLAKMTQPTPRLGATEDSETGNSASTWADGDDSSGASTPAPGDEDGVAMSSDVNGYDVVKVQPDMTDHTFSQEVKCTGTGKVKGWIDWGRDGSFSEADDASDQVSCPSGDNTVTLHWTVPTTAKRSVAGDDEGSATFMRVRISAQDDDLQPTGFTSEGEVEDYQAAVMIPQMSVLVNLAGSGTGRNNNTDQFDVALKDGNGETVATRTTAGSAQGTQTDAAIAAQAVTAGQPYKVSALLANDSTSTEDDYTNEIACRDVSKADSPEVTVSDDGGLTVPDDDANVQCTITRVPNSQAGKAKLTVKTVVTNEYAQPADPSKFDRTVTSDSGTPQKYENGVLKLVDSDNTASYTVTGSQKTGYSEPARTCTDNGTAMDSTDSMTFEAGHSYVCTLTYEGQPGSVTWSKTDSNGGALLSGSRWVLTTPDQKHVTIDDCTADGCSGDSDTLFDTDPTPGQFKVSGLDWGSYTLKERNPPTDYVIDSQSHGFDIMSGDSLTLTSDLGAITNTHSSGQLTIKRKVIDGGAQESDFTPSLKKTNGGDVDYTPDTAETVDNGKYTIGAGTMADGYRLAVGGTNPIHCTADDNTGGWNLDPAGDNAHQVSVYAGGDVTCTVPYETIKQTLQVNTVVNNNYGGTATADEFDRTVTDSNDNETKYTNGQQSDTTAGVSYKVTGSKKAGYSDPVVTYTIDGDAATPTDIGIAAEAGKDVVATVTYKDLPAQVTVKTVVNGGSLDPDNPAHTITGPNDYNATHKNGDATDSGLYAGGYKVDGAVEPGYSSKVTYTLTDADGNPQNTEANAEGTVNVPNGRHLEATVTYTQQGSLTVNTVVNNNHGGTATADDFTRTVTDSDGNTSKYTNGQQGDTTAGTLYKVTGSKKTGYSDPVYTVNGTPTNPTDDGIAAEGGQALVVTVTYKDLPAKVTVTSVFDNGTNPDVVGATRTVINADGTTTAYANGQTVSDLDAGTYNADGNDIPGYIKTVRYKLDGKNVPASGVTNGSVTVGVGQHLEATIVYNAMMSQLAVNVSGDYQFGGTDEGSGSKVTVKSGKNAVKVPTNAAEPTQVHSGTFSVAQLLNAGYLLRDITATDVATGQAIPIDAKGNFSVDPGTNVRVDIVNKDVPGTIEWSRFDKDGKTLLSGSKWQLSGPDGDTIDVEDCTALACTGFDQDPTAGRFRITDLKWGDWTLTETVAPEGHELSDPIKVSLDPSAKLTRVKSFKDGKSADVTPAPKPNVPKDPGASKPAAKKSPILGPLGATGTAVASIAIVAGVLAAIATGVLMIRRRRE